jgi:hypothetical protein
MLTFRRLLSEDDNVLPASVVSYHRSVEQTIADSLGEQVYQQAHRNETA